MDEKKPIDTADEPVTTDDGEFMDTGILYERPAAKPDADA